MRVVEILQGRLNTTDHQTFFASVELEGLTQIKPQRHERFDVFASAGSPGADEVGDAGVATAIATGLDLDKQRLTCAPVLFVALSVGLEGMLEFVRKDSQFAIAPGTNLLGNFDFLGGLEPFLYGAA